MGYQKIINLFDYIVLLDCKTKNWIEINDNSRDNYNTNSQITFKTSTSTLWHRGVVVIAAAQLHATKPEPRFCAGSNPVLRVSEIRDVEDL